MTIPLISELALQNFLSYGPQELSVDMRSLNVLIGPNGSGKSNVLEALTLLRGAAHDLQAVIREGGGFEEYLWKGPVLPGPLGIRLVVSRSEAAFDVILYSIHLTPSGTQFEVFGEHIVASETSKTSSGAIGPPEPVYHYYDGIGLIRPRENGQLGPSVALENLKDTRSVLSQRRDPDRYPEITYLADFFASIALFQEWNFGRRAPARLPQPTDLQSDFLQPDASNLGLVLHDISQTSAQREELGRYLRRFYEPARFISTRIQGGTIQLFIEEEGGRLIPATRLSDGTLRYLCLLAILLHPNPPPVIGIEEPELGLHPDIMPTIAELLKKASERTQLFVTTHSDALVSALSDTPESILVCESMPSGTTMKRLDPKSLQSWLDEYTLGDVWRMGALGGNRW